MPSATLDKKSALPHRTWIGIWGVTCVVVIWLLGLFDNADARHSDNPNILRLKGSEQHRELDLLFVGSSYVYSGINPAFFEPEGWSIYNLGSPSAGPYFIELIAEDYLKVATSAPGKMMLLIDPLMFAPSADNWRLYRIHRYLVDPISNESLLTRYGAWSDYLPLVSNSAEMGLRHLGRSVSGYYQEAELPELNRGFIPSELVVTEKVIRETEKYYTHLRDAAFDQKKAAYYLAFISRLRKDGHHVTLFEIPSHVVTSYLPPEYLQAYEQLLVDIEKQNLPLLRKELELDASCYRNIDHLNSKGAALVSSNLVARIRASSDK